MARKTNDLDKSSKNEIVQKKFTQNQKQKKYQQV